MTVKNNQIFETTIDKVVHGGQGLGTLEDGRKAFVWGVLPSEKVSFRITKNRKDYVEGVVVKVIKRSEHRIDALDEEYLSTSPWQVFDFNYENNQKQKILSETFSRAKLKFDNEINWYSGSEYLGYRNKMEYSFYGDDNGLHLALFGRGTHSKHITKGSSIASPEINKVALQVCGVLNSKKVRAGDLKTIIARSNLKGEVVCALFVKNENFQEINELKDICKGIVVVYSNPKSPASLRSRDLYKFGDVSLTDEILSKNFCYDVFSFFQVNLGVYVEVLKNIRKETSRVPVIDLYSGVGSIGLSLKNPRLLVESDKNNYGWAIKNSKGTSTEVVFSSSESALEYINHEDILTLDPPRAGLHQKLVDRILEVHPPKLIYLSCNPITQARDLALLQNSYEITSITGYNFFPRTPHIESLAVLVRK